MSSAERLFLFFLNIPHDLSVPVNSTSPQPSTALAHTPRSHRRCPW
jgi:hypothetical protein